MQHHRLERVELQLAGLRGVGNGGIHAHHHEHGLVHAFRDHRVHLAGHDRRTGLAWRQLDLGESGSRAAGQQAQVVGDLAQVQRGALDHAGQGDEITDIRGGTDRVRRRADGQAGELGEVTCRKFAEPHVGADAGADRSTAQVHHAERLMLLLQQRRIGSELGGERAEFLAEGHGYGVLQLRAADLHHGHGALRERGERGAELAGAVDQRARGLDERKTCRCGVGVVGGLGFVHRVVRVDDLVLAARVVAEFQRTVRDDLVDVHVGGGAGAALQHVDGELVVEFAGDHVGAGAVDQFGLVGVDAAKLAVGACAGALHGTVGVDDFRVVAHGDAGDGEVADGAERVDAPVGVGRHRRRTDAVVFDARGLRLDARLVHGCRCGCCFRCARG